MPVRFLIADDYSAHQKLMANIISFLGGAMRYAENGHEALQLAQSEEFDIVLMDLQMPGLGGVAAADRLIGGWSAHPHRPRIIAVTADSAPERRVLCRAIGMDGFIAKPYEAATLKTALQQVIMFGHCWTEGVPERMLDMAKFLDVAEKMDFDAWAAEMPQALRELSAAMDQTGSGPCAARLVELRDDARALGFVKLEQTIESVINGTAVPASWLDGALADLQLCLIASRESLCLSREQTLAAA